MGYYNRLAPHWQKTVGADGGPLKSLILNDLTLDAIHALEGRAILELGAGNGYLMALLTRRFPDQRPERLVVSDQSRPMLDLARRHHPVHAAEYSIIDVGHHIPFPDESFDCVVADMLFHELNTGTLRRALAEIHRVLRPGGRLIGAVHHPLSVDAMKRAGLLRRGPGGVTLMPCDDLYTPVVQRREAAYHTAFRQWGRLESSFHKVFAPPEFTSGTPGMKGASRLPIALWFQCTRAPASDTL